MSRDTDWQRALYLPLTILAWLAVVIVIIWLLGHILKTVLTLVLAAVLAFAFTPLVSYFARYMPRALAIALAYILGVGIVVGLGALVVEQAANQVTNLVTNLPNYQTEVSRLRHPIVQALHPFGVNDQNYNQTVKQLTTYLQSIGTSAAKGSLDIVTGIVGTVVDIVLVVMLSVYLTADGHRLAVLMRREAEGRQRVQLNILFAIINQVVGGYIRGQLTLALLIGTLVGIGLFILQVPYAILLGVLAFFMEFIPVVGVLVSGAVSVLVALTQGWVKAAIVLAYFIVVHVIEGDVVGPRIMGRAVGIHPATALIALVAGTELFGIWGALFGAPLAGLLQAIGTAAWRELRGTEPQAVLETVVETTKEVVEESASGAKPVPPRS